MYLNTIADLLTIQMHEQCDVYDLGNSNFCLIHNSQDRDITTYPQMQKSISHGGELLFRAMYKSNVDSVAIEFLENVTKYLEGLKYGLIIGQWRFNEIRATDLPNVVARRENDVITYYVDFRAVYEKN